MGTRVPRENRGTANFISGGRSRVKAAMLVRECEEYIRLTLKSARNVRFQAACFATSKSAERNC